jgi:hypothetical protein
MSVWDWVYEFQQQALDNDDDQRAELLYLFTQASELTETNPDQALAILAQGRALAEQLREPWWVLFFDHWRLQVLLFFKRDYGAARDLAVRAAVEARKPAYRHLPQRLCVHEDLIMAHIGTDPEGYASLIEQALVYMQQELTSDLECRFCILGLHATFQIERGRLDEAQDVCMRYLQFSGSEGELHSLADAHLLLCRLAYRRGDWSALLEWALAGEETARASEQPMRVTEALAWQAAVARQQNHDRIAKRLYRRATARPSRYNATPENGYYEALCAYHMVAGDHEAVLKVHEQHLTAIKNKGQIATEARCHVARCRLLAQMGLPLADEFAASRTAIQRLAKPATLQAELDQIETMHDQR